MRCQQWPDGHRQGCRFTSSTQRRWGCDASLQRAAREGARHFYQLRQQRQELARDSERDVLSQRSAPGVFTGDAYGIVSAADARGRALDMKRSGASDADTSLGPLALPHPYTTAASTDLGPLATPHPRRTTPRSSLGPLATPHPRRIATGLGSQRRMGQSRVARPQRRRSGARVRGLQLRSCRADTGDAPVALSLHSASSSGAAPGDATPAVFLDVQLDDPRRGNLSEEPAQWETARLHANLAGVIRSALLHQEPKEFAGLLDQ